MTKEQIEQAFALRMLMVKYNLRPPQVLSLLTIIDKEK